MGGQRHHPPTLFLGTRAGTYFTEGWVGPKAGLGGQEKSYLHRDSIPRPPSPYLIAITRGVTLAHTQYL